jgi:hypothetical protein
MKNKYLAFLLIGFLCLFYSAKNCTVFSQTNPVITVNPTSIFVELEEGDALTEILTISNDGFSDLGYNISLASGNSIDSEIVGNWNVYYDWGCDGVTSSITINLMEDYTFLTSSSSTGTWETYGDSVKWIYVSGTTYKGLYSDGTIDGTMASYTGNTGCFTADKIDETFLKASISNGELDENEELDDNGDLFDISKTINTSNNLTTLVDTNRVLI